MPFAAGECLAALLRRERTVDAEVGSMLLALALHKWMHTPTQT